MWQLKDNAKRTISVASLMTKDQRSCQFNPLLPQLEIIENAKRKEEPTAPRLVNPETRASSETPRLKAASAQGRVSDTTLTSRHVIGESNACIFNEQCSSALELGATQTSRMTAAPSARDSTRKPIRRSKSYLDHTEKAVEPF